MDLSIPRDRSGTFDPKLIAKYQRRFPDFNDKIISMYARGVASNDVGSIRRILKDEHHVDIAELISRLDAQAV